MKDQNGKENCGHATRVDEKFAITLIVYGLFFRNLFRERERESSLKTCSKRGFELFLTLQRLSATWTGSDANSSSTRVYVSREERDLSRMEKKGRRTFLVAIWFPFPFLFFSIPFSFFFFFLSFIVFRSVSPSFAYSPFPSPPTLSLSVAHARTFIYISHGKCNE